MSQLRNLFLLLGLIAVVLVATVGYGQVMFKTPATPPVVEKVVPPGVYSQASAKYCGPGFTLDGKVQGDGTVALPYYCERVADTPPSVPCETHQTWRPVSDPMGKGRWLCPSIMR